MVSSYSSVISSGSNGVIFRLLTIWKGSLHKLMYQDLVGYLVIYYAIRIIYHLLLNDRGKENFENVMVICAQVAKETPLRFILGFFVSGVIGRWMFLYETVPLIDTQAFFVQALLEGHGDPQFVMETLPDGRRKEIGKAPENYDPKFSERIRFHIMRYIMLAWIFLMLDISEQIDVRFNYSKDPASNAPSLASHEDTAHHQSRTLLTENEMEEGVQPHHKESQIEDAESVSRSTREVSSSDKSARKVSAEEKQEEESIARVCHSINNDPVVRETFNRLVTKDEMRVLQHLNSKNHSMFGKGCGLEYWVPLQWAVRVIQKATGQGYFPDPRFIGGTIAKISRLREDMLKYRNHAKLIMPLVYTQVVIIAVYTYFLAVLIGSQFKAPLNPNVIRNSTTKSTSRCAVDLKVPFFEILTFLFFMGWLKVAICVMDPFGTDDEDFDISDQLNYNLRRCQEVISRESYPPLLQRAQTSYFALAPSKNDNLKRYLEENHRLMEVETNEDALFPSDVQSSVKKEPTSRLHRWLARVRYAMLKP